MWRPSKGRLSVLHGDYTGGNDKMPGNNHRINLTVPDGVYADLRSYMRENGLYAEATACLSLVIRALYAYELQKANTVPPACGKALAARAGAKPAQTS